MARAFLVSLKDPSKRFEVLKYNTQTQTATLKGQYAPFEIRPFNKAYMAEKGYKLITE